ncbi:hypothetical protein PTKIN_Ptkin08bG0180700 [Pterospermum kingtungense]
MQSTKPHLALLASPGMGHLIPVLELAKRFVSQQSFKVTVFIVAADHASISNSSLLKSPPDLDDDLLDIILLPFIDLSNILEPDASYTTKILTMMLESLPFLRSEISKREFRPSALVVDLFGTDAFPIADEFNMLKYVFIASNAWFFAVMLFSPEIDPKEVVEHAKNQKPLEIPGCNKSIKLEDTLEPFLVDPNDPFYQGFIASAIKMSMADGILVNSWEELEPTILKTLGEAEKVPVYPIGPVVRPTEENPDLGHQAIKNWLDKQPRESVIYVSFGSGGTLSAQQVLELAWGLELSQQRFLWVVRPPNEADTTGTYFTLGNGCDGTPDYLPDGFLARTRDRGLVVPMWAPQVEVLSHPSVGGFLTHCGWNSVMESAVNGVPMIAWPLSSEQKLNARMLTEDIGGSIRAKAAETDGLVGREEIKSMVQRILVDSEGQTIRERVKELKISAAKALAEGGSSYNSLSQVAQICVQHLKTKAYGA